MALRVDGIRSRLRWKRQIENPLLLRERHRRHRRSETQIHTYDGDAAPFRTFRMQFAGKIACRWQQIKNTF